MRLLTGLAPLQAADGALIQNSREVQMASTLTEETHQDTAGDVSGDRGVARKRVRTLLARLNAFTLLTMNAAPAPRADLSAPHRPDQE